MSISPDDTPELTPYVGTPAADLLLLSWWYLMASERGGEDLEQGFSVALAPVGAFLAAMRQCDLVYVADEQGIYFAAWFEPKMNGAFYGLWIRKDRRHNADCQQLVLDSISYGLERYRVLILATMRERVVEQGARFGFVSMGTIPHLFDGEPTHVAWIDSEHFEPVREWYDLQTAGGHRRLDA